MYKIKIIMDAITAAGENIDVFLCFFWGLCEN